MGTNVRAELPEHRKKLICSRVQYLITPKNMLEVCQLLQTTYNTVVQWLYGYRAPDLPALLAIQTAFDTSLDWLLGLSDDPTCLPEAHDRPQWDTTHGLRKVPAGYLNAFLNRVQCLIKRTETVADFAEAIGISVETIHGWKYRRSTPSIVTVLMICETFEVSADWLLGLTDEGGPE